MSPTIALHSHIFLLYLISIAGILITAGLILVVLQLFNKRDIAPIWRTYRGWLVMIAVIGIFIFAGRGAVITGVGICSVMHDPYDPRINGWFGLFMAMPVFAINFLLIVPILRNQSKPRARRNPRPHRQPDLRRTAISAYGGLLSGFAVK